ncbi:hypothetical protein MVEG_06354 [Podila verticillata NRRL 6337]|nr:hypothetical protein MVEG_06354 [Podila verticillata NRRL 6337]
MNQQPYSEDPLAVLMGQLQSLSLDGGPNPSTSTHLEDPRSGLLQQQLEALNIYHHNNRNNSIFSSRLEDVMYQQASAQFQFEWDAFIQMVQHVDELKLQLASQKALLDPTAYATRLGQYYLASFMTTKPAFLKNFTATVCEWFAINFGGEGGELLHLNELRILDDCIVVCECIPGLLGLRKELISVREQEVEDRHRMREIENRLVNELHQPGSQ